MKNLLLISLFILVSFNVVGQQCTSITPAVYHIYASSTSVTYNSDVYISALGDRDQNYLAKVNFRIQNLSSSAYLIYFINGAYVGSGSEAIFTTTVVPLFCNNLPISSFVLKCVNSNSPKGPANVSVSITSISPHGPSPSGGALGLPSSTVINFHQ